MRYASQKKIAQLCCAAGLLLLLSALEVFAQCKDGEVKHTLGKDKCSVSVCVKGSWGMPMDGNRCTLGSDSWCCEPTHVCSKNQPRTCEMSREYCEKHCAQSADPFKVQKCRTELNCAGKQTLNVPVNDFLGSNRQAEALATATVDQASD